MGRSRLEDAGEDRYPTYRERALKTYREGRRCKVCGAGLSIYNDSDTCFRHSKPKRKRGRPRK
jgi:hypothetical protein